MAALTPLQCFHSGCWSYDPALVKALFVSASDITAALLCLCSGPGLSAVWEMCAIKAAGFYNVSFLSNSFRSLTWERKQTNKQKKLITNPLHEREARQPLALSSPLYNFSHCLLVTPPPPPSVGECGGDGSDSPQ